MGADDLETALAETLRAVDAAAMFRFDSGNVGDAYARRCEAGATHHAGVLPGHHRDVLRRTADILGITYASV